MAKKTTEEMEPKVVRKEETRHLKCTLTRDEVMDAAQKAADAQQKIVELDAELTSFKDQHKGKVAEAEAEMARNSNLVRQKYDYRRTPCEVVMDYTHLSVRVHRLDTMETIEDRPMTKDEKSTLAI